MTGNEFTLEQAKNHPHRNHFITHDEADGLASYFMDKDIICGAPDYEAIYCTKDFEGLTVEEAGRKWGDYGSEDDYSEEWIQHMLCYLLGEDGTY